MPLPLHRSSAPQSTGPTHVIAIAAGKGGVGKSTVTVNLARALTEANYRVGILDADIYGPSLRRMLPEQQLPVQKGPTIIPAVCQGIKVISMAYFRQEGIATAVRAPIANSLITQFCDQVEWGLLDYLLIDFPPGTGDIQLTLSQRAKLRGAVMVTTPQQVAVMDVRKAMHLFSQVNVPILGIVENMSYYIHEKSGEVLHLFGSDGGKLLAEEAGVPLLGQIPVDPLLSCSGDEGVSLFNQAEIKSPGVAAFRALARDIIQRMAGLQSENLIKRLTQPDPMHLDIEWNDRSVPVSYTHLTLPTIA